MTRSSLWRSFESDDAFLLKVLRFIILVTGIILLGFTGVLELTWPQQLVLGSSRFCLQSGWTAAQESYLVTLTLMLASGYTTFRYGFWRIATTMKFFFDPGSTWSWLDGFFMCLLLIAEIYSFAILFFGYMQTIWPLRRIPGDPGKWPSVDLLIPITNL
jgi:cellulose synthase (UDP-forming)